ncbi:energy transducer TonB [Chryseobacterium indoltheticum]|uniref:energy transducer TonB n=1 Tax=Chryseobacterium indoltheticum TaxID=254 RepID=UPI003F491332
MIDEKIDSNSNLVIKLLHTSSGNCRNDRVARIRFEKHNSKVFNEVEHPAEFAEGINVFRQKLLKNFKFKNIKSKTSEKCELTFVIERDGTLTDIKASGTNESFNNEAIRAVSKIKGKWNPATINGQKVRYRFRCTSQHKL